MGWLDWWSGLIVSCVRGNCEVRVVLSRDVGCVYILSHDVCRDGDGRFRTDQ